MIRIAIPLAGILFGFAAFALRSERPVQAAPAPANTGVPTRIGVQPNIPEAKDVMVPTSVAYAERVSPPAIPVVSPVIKALPEPHVQNRPRMLALLERELSLSADQRRHVETLLLRREAEIDIHHRQLRTVGAISGQAYHQHMQELRAQLYLQIGQVLDTEQHQRFQVLIANGALNDVIGFPMDEGMVALD